MSAAEAAVNPRHLSQSYEHFTPPDYCEASRQVMGSIDLDPASSEIANRIVKAKRIFTEEQNGFMRPWKGNVLCNPPGGICNAEGVMLPPRVKGVKRAPGTYLGGQSSAVAWWRKTFREFITGPSRSAIFYGFTVEICQTTQQLEGESVFEAQALCFPSERIRFWHLNHQGELAPNPSPTHANVIVYLGKQRALFKKRFSDFGKVVLT